MKKKTLPLIFVTLLLGLASQPAHAVVPPPGGYPNFTTAVGDNALRALTTGVGNTAIGTFSLFSVSTGNFNTAVGAGSLDLNQADSNTATGAAALLFNTTGTENTANGTAALEFNETGSNNTASGAFALFNNTTGFSNTAIGFNALLSNTGGIYNTATGAYALQDNHGSENTANGFGALSSNIDGAFNTAIGKSALQTNLNGLRNTAVGWAALVGNEVGDSNTAVGNVALNSNSSGNGNTAIGDAAGYSLTTGSGNVCIGEGVQGVAGASNTTWIRNVYATVANGRAVYVNSDNKIGTLSSSRRFKEDIQPMNKKSETLFALKPVTFRYKKDADPSQALSFGLIAEDVAKISPELITRDENGNPQTVRYEAINAMLLNEFLKEHSKNEEQGATIARLEKQLETVTATLQKVSARLELNKSEPQVAENSE